MTMSVTSPTSRRWMTPPPIYDSHGTSQTTTLKPYLLLPHLLSLTWLAYPILSLLFVAFRLLLSSASAQDAVSDAKGDLLTSCNAAEQAATAAASLPRYMATASNKQISDAVNDTMNAARAALVLSLTILEAIINFAIDIYRSTFLCFLELIVRGALGLLISAVQEITNFLQNTLGSIATSIQSDVASANSAISSAVSALNKVNPFGNVSVPQFSIPSLSALQNVTIPTDFEDALVKLNASLPTLDQVRSAIESVVDTPFEDLKADINNTFAGLSFNVSVLPVPQQDTVSFCGQLDTSVVDDLGRDLLKATWIGIIILIVLALILLAANCLKEWYKWRCMHKHLEYTRQAWLTDPTLQHSAPISSVPTMTMTDHNLLILAASSAHPLLTRIANTLSRLLRLTPVQHIHIQWFFHYVFHPPALACFLIGFFGLLSVEMQLLALGPLEAKYQQQVTTSVSDFSNSIATQMNASMFNQSSLYANDINSRVDSIQSTINDGVFGWVNGTTTTLNDTLVTFYSDIQNAISTVFNGTVLESPVQDFISCIIGSKVQALENVLTFLQENLQVNIPRVNESILVLSSADVNEVTQPISEAAVGGGTDGSSGVVGKLVNSYVASLKKERVMFGIFMGLWGIVVLMACSILFYHSYMKQWIESRKKRKWQKEHRDVIDSISAPFKINSVLNLSNEDEKVSRQPTSAPGVSPKRSFFRNTSSKITPPSPTDAERNVPGYHASPGLRPTVERSWDSFLDAGTQEGPSTFNEKRSAKKRIPRKLTSIGRKAMGRERFVSDEERANMSAADAHSGEPGEQQQGGWLKKTLTMFHKKDHDEESDAGSDRTAQSSRPRPKLTISTDRDIPRAERDQLPTIETSHSPVNIPGSAWSMSPGDARTLPWLPNPMQTASRRPFDSGVKPLLPKSRKIANFPHVVYSTRIPSIIVSPKYETTKPLAITTPYGLKQPADVPRSASSPRMTMASAYQTQATNSRPSRLSLAPPMDHRRSVSVPYSQQDMTPVTRTLTTTHARRSSHSIDPFRTPFDDDARVAHDQPATKSANPFANEFAVVAL